MRNCNGHLPSAKHQNVMEFNSLSRLTNAKHIYIYIYTHTYIQLGLVVRRFVLRRFTFTALVQSDRALPTCGPSMSHLKRPFPIQCASSSFPFCMCFFFFYFSAVLWSWLWFSHPWRPSKRQKRKKIKTVDVTFCLDVFWTTAWAFFSKIKSDLFIFF